MTKKEEALYREASYRKLREDAPRIREWAERVGAPEVEEQLSRGTSLIVGPRTREEFETQMAETKETIKQNRQNRRG